MILKYKATIPVSKIFFRDFEFKETSSLYRVMEFIQSQMNFVPDMMIVFQGVDEKGKVVHEYGLFDMGDGSVDNITLGDSQRAGDMVLRFVYNVSKNLFIDLTFMESYAADPRTEYPVVSAEKGQAPQQFSAAYFEDETAGRPCGVPHPVEVNDDEVGEDDGDEADDEDGFDEDELPEGTE